MPMRFKLDFTLKTSQERLNYLKENVDFDQLTKKDVETCTDYVLYGKDPDKDDTSMVDRKEIYIKTHYNSYNKTEPVSLEGLMENPAFDESMLTQDRHIYKKTKPTIDREKCKDIPGMQELWDAIDKLDHLLKLAKGEVEPQEGEQVPNYDSKQLYHLNHHLIALRKQQYMLKDSAFPEFMAAKNYGSFYESPTMAEMNYPVFPCGTMRSEKDPDFMNPTISQRELVTNVEEKIEELKKANKPYVNFMDKSHIYQLCLNYYQIKDQAEKNPDSPLNNLLWTLDFYIEKANLSEQQRLIVAAKKQGLLNKEICELLMEKMGIYHQENYISTIWNKVCGLIADAADLNYDEWCCKDYKAAWKKCNCCGRLMLRDPRNFVRKAKALDGLTNRCKKCDQKKRRGEI